MCRYSISVGFMLWLFWCGQTNAQNIPYLLLHDELNGQQITHLPAYLKTGQGLTPQSAWKLLLSADDTDSLEFGYTDDRYWLGLQLLNQSDTDRWILEIDNPHIDYISMFIRSPNTSSTEWHVIDTTGDNRPFHSSSISHYNVALPLDFSTGSELELLVSLYKRYSSLRFNLRLWKRTAFQSYQLGQYTLYGAYFGFYLLIIIAAAFIFYFSRHRLYLWYLLYILVIGLYVLIDLGLGHQFLYPASGTLSNYMRITLNYGFIYTFLPFTQHYFETKRTLPTLHTALKLIILSTIALQISGTVAHFVFGMGGIAILTILNVIIVLSNILVLYCAALQLRINRTMALFYLVAYVPLITAIGYKVLMNFGLISDVLHRMSALQIGFFNEIFILTIGLGWQFRRLNKKEVESQRRIRKLQNEKLRAYIDGMEEERSRIAMELHDSVGSQLSHVLRVAEGNTSNHPKDGMQSMIKKVIGDIRSISHQLAPPGLHLAGLRDNLQQLVHDINDRSAITYHIQLLDLPNAVTDNMATQIYRLVQEGVNNIEKHSRADLATIQLIGHEDQIVLTIGDDGVGFSDGQQSASGIGLKNLRRRTEQLGGTIEISSEKNKGVHIVIVIPLDNNTL